jgi:hypothetical protein
MLTEGLLGVDEPLVPPDVLPELLPPILNVVFTTGQIPPLVQALK